MLSSDVCNTQTVEQQPQRQVSMNHHGGDYCGDSGAGGGSFSGSGGGGIEYNDDPINIYNHSQQPQQEQQQPERIPSFHHQPQQQQQNYVVHQQQQQLNPPQVSMGNNDCRGKSNVLVEGIAPEDSDVLFGTAFSWRRPTNQWFKDILCKNSHRLASSGNGNDNNNGKRGGGGGGTVPDVLATSLLRGFFNRGIRFLRPDQSNSQWVIIDNMEMKQIIIHGLRYYWKQQQHPNHQANTEDGFNSYRGGWEQQQHSHSNNQRDQQYCQQDASSELQGPGFASNQHHVVYDSLPSRRPPKQHSVPTNKCQQFDPSSRRNGGGGRGGNGFVARRETFSEDQVQEQSRKMRMMMRRNNSLGPKHHMNRTNDDHDSSQINGGRNNTGYLQQQPNRRSTMPVLAGENGNFSCNNGPQQNFQQHPQKQLNPDDASNQNVPSVSYDQHEKEAMAMNRQQQPPRQTLYNGNNRSRVNNNNVGGYMPSYHDHQNGGFDGNNFINEDPDLYDQQINENGNSSYHQFNNRQNSRYGKSSISGPMSCPQQQHQYHTGGGGGCGTSVAASTGGIPTTISIVTNSSPTISSNDDNETVSVLSHTTSDFRLKGVLSSGNIARPGSAIRKEISHGTLNGNSNHLESNNALLPTEELVKEVTSSSDGDVAVVEESPKAAAAATPGGITQQQDPDTTPSALLPVSNSPAASQPQHCDDENYVASTNDEANITMTKNDQSNLSSPNLLLSTASAASSCGDVFDNDFLNSSFPNLDDVIGL